MTAKDETEVRRATEVAGKKSGVQSKRSTPSNTFRHMRTYMDIVNNSKSPARRFSKGENNQFKLSLIARPSLNIDIDERIMDGAKELFTELFGDSFPEQMRMTKQEILNVALQKN